MPAEEDERSPSPTPDLRANAAPSSPRTPVSARNGSPPTTGSAGNGRQRASSHRTTVQQTPNGGKVNKGPWTPAEDDHLRQIVDQDGPQHWSAIAAKLGSRSGKQCRERWHNHLAPDVDKRPWTAEEEELLQRLIAEFGNRWAEIARRMPGRTDNAIKNHVNSTRRRNESRQRQMEAAMRTAPVMGPSPSSVSPAPEKKRRGRKRKDAGAQITPSLLPPSPTASDLPSPHVTAASALATLPTSAPTTPSWSNAVPRIDTSQYFATPEHRHMESAHAHVNNDPYEGIGGTASSNGFLHEGSHLPPADVGVNTGAVEHSFALNDVVNVVIGAVGAVIDVTHNLQSPSLHGVLSPTSSPFRSPPSIVRTSQSPFLPSMQTPRSRARSPPLRRRNSRFVPPSPNSFVPPSPSWESPQRGAGAHQPLLPAWQSPSPATPLHDVGTPSRGTQFDSSTPTNSLLFSPGFTTEAQFVAEPGYTTPQSNRTRRSLFTAGESPRKRTRGLEPILQPDENQSDNEKDGTAEMADMAVQFLRSQQ